MQTTVQFLVDMDAKVQGKEYHGVRVWLLLDLYNLVKGIYHLEDLITCYIAKPQAAGPAVHHHGRQLCCTNFWLFPRERVEG